MCTKRQTTAILTLMVLFYSSIAAAEVYTWVDAKGETHFSDKPPASLLIASLDTTFYDVEKIAGQVAEPAVEPVTSQEAQSEGETAPPQVIPVSNLRQALCRDHRRHLAVFQEEGAEYYYDDQGEPRVVWGVEGFYRQKKRYLSASEVVKKAKQVALEIERYCDNPLDKALQAKARQDWIRSEYCDVSQVILADLKHPFMRTAAAEIKKQEQEVDRFCSDYSANKYRNDERYYPMSLTVERLQQQHFLYR